MDSNFSTINGYAVEDPLVLNHKKNSKFPLASLGFYVTNNLGLASNKVSKTKKGGSFFLELWKFAWKIEQM